MSEKTFTVQKVSEDEFWIARNGQDVLVVVVDHEEAEEFSDFVVNALNAAYKNSEPIK